MDNFTNSWNYDNTLDCEEIKNNGLYLIFTGYVLPLISPQVRAYLHEKILFIKNAGNIAGKLVSVSEYGFKNVQDLSNNSDMVDFITRLCSKKDLHVLPKQIIDIAWNFSGDTDNGKKENREESWNKLLKEIDRIHELNVLDKTTKP